MFPSLDLVAEDVGVAQASSGSTAEIATAKRLKFSLALRALLGGKIKITEVTLIDPVITVPQAKAGAKAGDDAGRRKLGVCLAAKSQPRQARHRERHGDPAAVGRHARQADRRADAASLAAFDRRSARVRRQGRARRRSSCMSRARSRASAVPRRRRDADLGLGRGACRISPRGSRSTARRFIRARRSRSNR